MKEMHNPFPTITKQLKLHPHCCHQLREVIKEFLDLDIIDVKLLEKITYGEVAMFYWLLVNHYNMPPIPKEE